MILLKPITSKNSHTTKILNTSSPVQNPPETILQNNNMSIPEYSFQSIISSSSNNCDTLIPTKHGTYNFKTKKNLFNSDSDSKISYTKKYMKQIKNSNVNKTVNFYYKRYNGFKE